MLVGDPSEGVWEGSEIRVESGKVLGPDIHCCVPGEDKLLDEGAE